MPILAQTAQSPFGGLPGQFGFYKYDNTPFVPTGSSVATFATQGTGNGNQSIDVAILNAGITSGVVTATLTGGGPGNFRTTTQTFGSNIVAAMGSVFADFARWAGVIITADSTSPLMVNTCVVIDGNNGYRFTVTLPTSTYDLPQRIVQTNYYDEVMITDVGAKVLYFINLPFGIGTATTWPVYAITLPGTYGAATPQFVELQAGPGIPGGYVISLGGAVLFYNTSAGTVDWIYDLPSGLASLNATSSSSYAATLVTGGANDSLYVFSVSASGMTPLLKSNAGALGVCSITSLQTYQRFGGPYNSTAMYGAYLPSVGSSGYVLIDVDLVTGAIYAQEDVYKADFGQVSDGGSVTGSGQQMANVVGIARIPWGSGILPEFLGNSTSGGTPLQGLLSVFAPFSVISSNPFTALAPGVVSVTNYPISQVTFTTSAVAGFSTFQI